MIKHRYTILQLLILLFFAGLISACSLLDDNEKDVLPAQPALQNQIPIKVLWKKTPVSGDVHEYTKFSPVITSQQIILADDKGQLVALNQKTGKTIWHKKADSHFSTPPCYGDEQLYLGTDNAELIAVNAGNGQILWKTPVKNELIGKPVYADHLVIAKTVDGQLIAFSSNKGQKVWEYDEQNPDLILKGDSSPIVADDKVITGFSDGKLVVLQLADGTLLWEKQVADAQGFSSISRMVDISSTPVVENNMIYVGTYQGNLSALSLDEGTTIWQHAISTYSGIATDPRDVFATDSAGILWAFNKQTGTVDWKQNALAEYMLTAPTVYKKYLLVGDNIGNLQVFSKRDGQLLAREKIASHPIYVAPIVVHDTVYVLASDGKMSALEIGA